MTEFPVFPQESEEERLARMARFMGIEEVLPMRHLSDSRVQEKLFEVKIKFVDLRVQTICDQYSNSTGIEISPMARDLISLIHQAIVADSHSTWTGDRLEALNQYLSTLDSKLAEIVRDEGIEERMTTFDVLHWVSKDRDLARICIIQKQLK